VEPFLSVVQEGANTRMPSPASSNVLVSSSAAETGIAQSQRGLALEVSSETANQMYTALTVRLKKTLEQIHMAMNYSEIAKLNTYVDNIQDQEKHRIKETHESMANNLMLTQQMYLMQTRETDRLSSRIRALLLSMLAVALIFALLPFSGTGLGVGAIVLVVVVYCVCLLLYFRSVKLRRFDDWSKRYWRNDINPADTVTSAVDVDGEQGECPSANGAADLIA